MVVGDTKPIISGYPKNPIKASDAMRLQWLPLIGQVHCRLRAEFGILPQHIVTTANLQILHNKRKRSDVESL